MRNENGHERSSDFEARHAAIIARTLRWADEAAARQEYTEAVRWVQTVQSLGEALPTDYEAKHRRWLEALERRAKRSRRTAG